MSKSMWSKILIFSLIVFIGAGFILGNFKFAYGSESNVQKEDGSPKSNVQVPSNLPGLIENGERVNFIVFLKWLFPFMLSVAAILAVLMIVIAGTRWVVSAGSEAEIKAARDMITNAILGLILAFAAWLIINTINPDIMKGLTKKAESFFVEEQIMKIKN